MILLFKKGFPDSSVGKESACNAGDPSLIPGSGRSTGEGIGYPLHYSWVSLVAQLVKNPLQCGRPGFDPSVGKIPWRRKWQPTPVFLPETCLKQRSLVGYGPWGHRELTQLSTAQQQYLYYYYSCFYKYSYIYYICVLYTSE